MRKVFIDLGTYDGDSIEQFYNWYKLVDDPNKYDVYGFEPNPEMFKLAQKKVGGKKNVKLQRQAAWIADEVREFAVDDIGSTLMDSKINWESSPKTKVKCFDFSKWLKSNFTDEDFIVLKMDIEGAEFPLLKKMIANSTDRLISQFLIEFHPNKVRDYTTTNKNDLIQRLAHRGGDIIEWH